ncbi:unnamed protein product [Phytophthora lilii]|uniref:Unnamed protein product n=1 Tax=Phytophthora lilii TaxID=2077276 RepID=A0A9W6UDJ9_9STRA|nr:unnamed protein product [Phytophthora lilii]
MLVIAAQGMLAIAYPTFGAIFNQLSGHEQTAFVFVLPIIKFVIKQFIAKVSSHLQEYMGPTVVFSVDVCNVLYVAICVQTAVSPLTTTLLLTSDACFVLLALRSIYFQKNFANKTRLPSGLRTLSAPSNYLQDLLDLIRENFKGAARSDDLSSSIRVRAPFPLTLSNTSTAFMNELILARQHTAGDIDLGGGLCIGLSAPVATAWMAGEAKLLKSHSVPTALDHHRTAPTLRSMHGSLFARSGLSISSQIFLQNNYAKVACSNSCRISSTASLGVPVRHKILLEIAQESLQALFHSEYVVMAEFIECVIPVLYGVYLAFLYHLPTAAYYPHTSSLTPEKFASTEINIMLYASVEFASFIGINLVIQRKFGFLPLYQIAFVFETQVRTLQSHLFVWILCILQITLVHNGKYCRGMLALSLL